MADRTAGERPRLRDLGIGVGSHRPGRRNAITDVPGVRVGHRTLRRAPELHTGVTAVVPRGVGPGEPLAAGVFTGNGYGKLVGATQVGELGVIETPIVLTSTLSAFRAADALVGWVLARPGCELVRSLNPVVGECNDGLLSDIRSRPVREEHVWTALDGAVGGPVPMGCVGAGTGTVALGFKAGIGSASRVVWLNGGFRSPDGIARGAFLGGTPREAPREPPRGAHRASREEDRAPVVPGANSASRVSHGVVATVGALVQANFGGTLRVRGREIRPDFPSDAAGGTAGGVGPGDGGSCMIVVATDAPLDARQLARVARRAVFALGRVGAAYTHGSGDYGIAFSTTVARTVPYDGTLDPLFEATLDVVEEAVLDALLAAVPTTGPGGRTPPTLRPDALR